MVKERNFFKVCLTILGLALSQSAVSQPLIVLFGSHNAEPFAFVEKEFLVGGIVKDIADELGSQLNIDIRYINVPRRRMEHYLISGEGHIRLMANPKWARNPDQFQWSTPLFDEYDSFVVQKGSSLRIRDFKDLFGKTLGTIHGYHYPALKDFFEHKKIIRDDTDNMTANFRRLGLGRIDSFIDSNIAIAYYLRKHNAHDRFIVAEKTASTHEIQAMMSQSLPVPFQTINAAFERMKRGGKIQEILERYR